jgi:hypothetical protein
VKKNHIINTTKQREEPDGTSGGHPRGTIREVYIRIEFLKNVIMNT